MTTINAKVICDSISPEGIRLTTLQLRYPRVIHSEFMTHRVFSRNASSSRAIPVQRLIQDVLDDPYIPIHWGKNQKGMQADEECNERIYIPSSVIDIQALKGGNYAKYTSFPFNGHRYTNEEAWLYARNYAVMMAQAFSAVGYHKQIVNRLLEPFSHINVVVSSTKWKNFFALRKHEDAMPEINALAKEMHKQLYGAMEESIKASNPELLQPGEWHLPYVTDADRHNAREYVIGAETAHDLEHYIDYIPPTEEEILIKLSVARCARVSYLTHEGKSPNMESDLKLYDDLVGSNPLHASPAEHQATPDKFWYEPGEHWQSPNLHGNFHGWIQYRKTLKNECVEG